MDDFASQINQLLNSKEGMQQLQNVAAALGLGNGNGGASTAPASPPPPAQESGFDVNQLMGILGQLGIGGQNGSTESPSPPANTPAPLATVPNASATNSTPNIDIGQIAGILGKLGLGSPGNSGSESPAPAIDFNMMLQVQKAMQRFTMGNKNVDLLRSLKPHFSEARQKKVDDAIKIMQLINMLPMLKETGLFGWGGDRK